MARTSLTDTKIKALKPRNKPYKASDGTVGGLHVAVSTAGGKVFCLTYKFEGKWRLLRLGAWPTFGLDEARDLARDAKKQLAQGIDPAAAKQAARTKAVADATTFRAVTADWLRWRQSALGAVTTDDLVKRLEKHVLPRFGDKPIADVTKADIKAVLDTLQAEEKYQTLKKVRNNIAQILRYAIDQEIPGVEVDWTQQVHRQYCRLLPPTRGTGRPFQAMIGFAPLLELVKQRCLRRWKSWLKQGGSEKENSSLHRTRHWMNCSPAI